MKPHLISRILRHLLMLVLPLALFACSEDPVSTNEKELGEAIYDPNATVELELTNKYFVPLVQASAYNLESRVMEYSFGANTTGRYIYVKQNGKWIECGWCPGTVSADMKILTVRYNESKTINTSQPHEIIACNQKIAFRNNAPYYTVNLHRGVSSPWINKASVSGSTQTKSDEFCGVGERCYIINKTNSPITVRHKGFDAKDKWYYDHADITISDHNVSNGVAVTTDSCSQAYEVLLYSDHKSTLIDSFYAPTGKKISNATLILEIDGKEVRTSNTLSSDLTLEPGKAYVYVVEWDGKELKFASDVQEEPVVHIYSDEGDPETTIKEVHEDGSIIISGDKDKIPQVGEYMASAPTALAPCGYLRKVVSVTKVSEDTYNIQTEQAALDEVIKECHVVLPIKLSIDPEGLPVETRGDDLSLISADLSLSATYADNVTITTEGAFEISADFILDIEDHTLQRVGVEVKGELDFKLNIKLSGKIWKEKDATQIGNSTYFGGYYTTIGLIPVFIGVYSSLYAVSNTKGEVYLSLTPFDAKWSYGTSYIWQREIDPATGKHIVTKDISDESPTLSSVFSKLDELNLGFSGSMDLGIAPCLDIVLYSDNIAKITVGPRPYVKASGTFELDFDYNNFHTTVNKDELSGSVGCDLYGSMDLLNILKTIDQEDADDSKWKFDLSPELTIFEIPFDAGFSLFPHFTDLEATPSDGMDGFSFSCYKKSFYWSLPYEDWGICYYPTDRVFTPNRARYVSLNGQEHDSGFSDEVDVFINDSELMPGVKYAVEPYVMWYGQHIYLKGTTMKIPQNDPDISGNGTLDPLQGTEL